ncbi:MAG: alpha/beta hydrolase [Planctomycetes bacterium]|nr:alpha/beta hydrolase [Planctomycetota bacterium]
MTPATPANPNAPDREVIYGRAGDIDLRLDLYLPAMPVARPAPCVVFVHGGGWNKGARTAFHWHARQMANLGFVAASVGYRLSGTAKYPAALDDCQRAVRWLRKHAEEFGIDTARFGAMGSSAGGHLVACLGVRETRDDSDAELRGLSSKVQCVVDVHGVHDIPLLSGSHLEKECLIEFLGGPLAECRTAWEDASPIRFVDTDSAPTMIIHDPGDSVVPYDDSAKFAAALIAAHRPVEFMPAPGAGHGFVYGPQGEWTKKVWPVALVWLRRFLL